MRMLYYLGLDISTARIGIAILDENQSIAYKEVLKFKDKLSLVEKAKELSEVIEILFNHYHIRKIFIEKPFVAFTGGGGQAATTAILQCFNGMCQYVAYRRFLIIPDLVDVRVGRSKMGIKIPRGTKGKDKKRVIIDYVVDRYKDSRTPFEYKLTPKGNYAPGTDDICDAIVVALSGPLLFP